MRALAAPDHIDPEPAARRRAVSRRRALASATAAAACVAAAAPQAADARLLSAVSQGGTIRLVDPLQATGSPNALFQPPPGLPAGVNTDQHETVVSLTDGAGYLTFSRGSFAGTLHRPFLADLRAETVTQLTPPAPTDPTSRSEVFALSPDGRRGVFVFSTTDDRNRRTEAVVVDTSATKTGPYPELARYSVPDGFTDEGHTVIGAQITNDARVAWTTRFRQNVVTSHGGFIAGPGIAPAEATGQLFPLGGERGARIVPGFGTALVSAADDFQVVADSVLVTSTTSAPFTKRRLTLPGIEFGAIGRGEAAPASTTDGRFLSWIDYTANTAPSNAQPRIVVYDTLTQGFVQSPGRLVDGVVPDAHVIAEVSDQTAIASFTLPPTIRLSQPAPTLQGTLKVKAPVGIVVHKIVGKTTVGDRRVDRLRLVGRVPLGNRKKGSNAIRWDLRVQGKKLSPGTYQVTLRALSGGKPVELSTPRKVRVR